MIYKVEKCKNHLNVKKSEINDRFKKFQLVGELQTLYSDRFQLLPFKEQGRVFTAAVGYGSLRPQTRSAVVVSEGAGLVGPPGPLLPSVCGESV